MNPSAQVKGSHDLLRSTIMSVAGVAVALTALALYVPAVTPFGNVFTLTVVAIYLPASAIILSRVLRFHPYKQFGTANLITLCRLAIGGLLAGFTAEAVISPAIIDAKLAWVFFASAVGSLILDGLDGYVARGQGLMSAFGARFDMEVDALQILILSIAAFVLAKAGWWILISGLLRYVFAGAAVFWPVLAKELPPSRRRKIVAATQGGVVAAILAPIIVPPLSTAAAGVALALLLYSFAVDIIWLFRARRSSQ